MFSSFLRRSSRSLLPISISLLASSIYCSDEVKAATAKLPWRIVSTTKAPSAIGPYSQAIVANGFVFCSGQIGLDPATGKLVDGGVENQTRQCLKNITALLDEAGSDVNNVVKVVVLLANIEDYALVNRIYAETFNEWKPARAAFAVKSLPANALIEIDVTATL